LRLRAGVDISHFSAAARVVLTAFRHYGLIVADNGSNWYFQGSADPSWDPALIGELKTIPAADFEAVDESALMADPNSGRVRGVPAAAVAPPPPPAPRAGATSPPPPPAPPASPPPPAATPVAVAVPVEPATPSPAVVPAPPAAADLRPVVSGASRRPPAAGTLVLAAVVGLVAIGGVVALGRRRRA
jgi:hypothetical protein